LHKTIESVLERGEKIDSLVAKSDGLSAQSKMFYTQVSEVLLFARVGLTDVPAGKEAEFLLHCHVNTSLIFVRRYPWLIHPQWLYSPAYPLMNSTTL
jgi:hypothetical protein